MEQERAAQENSLVWDIQPHVVTDSDGPASQPAWSSLLSEAGYLWSSPVPVCVILSVLINNSARDKQFPI